MHRIDTPTAQVDKFGAGKNGFTRGNPQTGVPATALDDDYFDAVQEELAGVVEAAGFALNKANRAQLLAAIQHLITLGVPDLKDASLTQKGVVQLSNATNSNSQILAATPKAVSDLGNLLLKITNNLSEIKDAGPAAVAQTLLNLGLGDAAKRGVGKLANQIPDISYFLANLGFSGHQDVPSLDVAGNLGLRWGTMAAMTAGPGQTVTFTRPFSSNCVFAIAFLNRPGSTNTGTSETMYLVSKSATQATFSKGGSETYSATYFALGY
ncbi:phage tail protein [Yersinia enterocolitica]|uniref:phage tail protein n=1 Tax=Yersinia enterocolitica TaxID=630 RepID=UPI00313E5D08